MTATYDLIASNVLTSSASSVTFSGISGSYRDLVLVAHARAGSNLAIRLNSDSGANYSQVYMLGTGSATSSSSSSGNTRFFVGEQVSSNTVFVLYSLQFLDYSATDKHKSILGRENNASSGTMAHAYRWANTSAITSMEIFSDGGGVIAATSSFYLYGIVS